MCIYTLLNARREVEMENKASDENEGIRDIGLEIKWKERNMKV